LILQELESGSKIKNDLLCLKFRATLELGGVQKGLVDKNLVSKDPLCQTVTLTQVALTGVQEANGSDKLLELNYLSVVGKL